ncbi:MAG: c-type cytochrome [Pseudomonadales bacterium]
MTFLLMACEGGGSSTPAIDQKLSQSIQPADPQLAAIYNRSCKNCHTVTATGAPLTGDKEAWEQRTVKGMDVMLNSVINGSGGMPPFGLCMDCDAEQFEALIDFMAQPPATQP